MTTTPDSASSNLPGKPPVVDLATWEAAREALLVREKAHTHEGDAIAAARRRLPMVEVDGAVEVTGRDGPVPFLDLFQGRDELVVYQHMWYDGAPYQPSWSPRVRPVGAPRSARREPGVVLRSLVQPDQPRRPVDRHRRRRARRLRRRVRRRHRHGDGQPGPDGLTRPSPAGYIWPWRTGPAGS